MLIMCKRCLEVFHFKSLISSERKYCPRVGCNGQIFEVDELMAPIIINLNQKRYRTSFCCSGHWYDSRVDTYIAFEHHIELPVVPKGFDVEYPNSDTTNGTVIRSSWGYGRNATKEQKLIQIAKDNLTLLEWSEVLPKFSSTYLIK